MQNPRALRWSLLAVVATALLLSLPAVAAEPVGHTVAYGFLLEVNVETGENEVIGDTGLADHFRALTTSPSGELYGVVWTEDGYSLATVDKETGAGTIIGELGVDEIPLGFSFDGKGRLWMTAADTLYLVDSGTGAATLFAPLERQVDSLTIRWRKAYAFTYDGEQGTWLEELDLETGELTPLWDLNDLDVGIIGSSFSRDGTLWMLGRGGGTLNVVPLGFFKMPDLNTGEVEETFFEVYHFGAVEAGMQNLALRQWPKLLDMTFR